MGLPDTVPYLDWRWDDFVFLALAGVMLGSALLVVVGRDIIRSALWLILSFAGLAGIYGLLASPFMAITQVLVYMGAIAVLILFAVMITQSKRGPAKLVFQRQWWAGAIAAFVLVILMTISIMFTEWPLAGTEIDPGRRARHRPDAVRGLSVRLRGSRCAPARRGDRRSVPRPS